MIDWILRIVLFAMFVSMMISFTFALLAISDPEDDDLTEEFFGEDEK